MFDFKKSNLNRSFLGYFILLAAVVFVTLFGIVGIGRPAGVIPFSDVRFFYIAGSMLAGGENPYVYESFKHWAQNFGLAGDFIGVFAYPPQSFIMWLPLSLLSFDQARWVWTFLSLCLLAISTVLVLSTVEKYETVNGKSIGKGELAILAAVMIGNPFVSHVIWTGQSSFIVLAAMVLLFDQMAKNKVWIPALFLAISTIKPQLSIFAFLLIILSGQWKIFAASIVFLVILLCYPVYLFGFDICLQWIISATAYQGEVSGGLSYNTNLASLFTAYGIPAAFKFAPLVLSVVVLFLAAKSREKDRQNYLNVVSLVSLSGLVFIYGRDYDMAILTSLIALLWVFARKSLFNAALIVFIFLVFFFPQRYSDFGSKLFEFRKILLLFAAWVFVCVGMLKSEPDKKTALGIRGG